MARSLAGGLCPHFSVDVTGSREELRDKVERNQPEAVVLNIEYWRLTDVESLHRDFPKLPIVCTHRIPDEEMWMAARRRRLNLLREICGVSRNRD